MKQKSPVQLAYESPWKLWNEIVRLCVYPLARLQFALAGIPWQKDWKIYGLPILQICRGSRVTIGPGLELRSTLASNPLAPYHPVVISTRNPHACIQIGKNFSMTGGSIVAEKNITIGNNTMIGANTLILDTDFHLLPIGVKSAKRVAVFKPVQIGNRVFVGTEALILKGASIASGSVIGARTVVSKNLLQKAVYVGNPCKLLRKI